jgi:hypothetical protein
MRVILSLVKKIANNSQLQLHHLVKKPVQERENRRLFAVDDRAARLASPHCPWQFDPLS